MPLSPAPIQENMTSGTKISPLWARWFDAIRREINRAPSYSVASLPTNLLAGSLAYVPDESGGAVLAFFDGMNWRRVTDRAVVS